MPQQGFENVPRAGSAEHGSSSPSADERSPAGDVQRTTVWLLLVRGDHQLNEVKAGKVAGLNQGFRFATVGEIESHFGCKPGYLGPIGLKKPLQVIADRSVAAERTFSQTVAADGHRQADIVRAFAQQGCKVGFVDRDEAALAAFASLKS